MPRYLKLLRTLATLEGVPGWAPTVFAILMGLASWKGMFDLLLPSVQTVGGGAVMLFEFVVSPVALLIFALSGLLYLLCMSEIEENTARAIWLPMVGWLGMLIVFSTMMGLSTFAWLIRSSKIPEAVAFYEKQSNDRYIGESDYRKMYQELRKVAGSLPVFRVSAVRDPEAMQYGVALLQMFRDAGIKTLNDTSNLSAPFPIDVYSTSVHGIIVYAKQNPGAQGAAASLRDAFGAAGIGVRPGRARENDSEPIDLTIGYR